MTAVATWIGALATVGLLIGAGFTVYYARNAFREQSDQVKLLKKQDERDVQQRRSAQAAQVYVFIPRGQQAEAAAELTARIHNASQQPVYDLEMTWHEGQNPKNQIGDPKKRDRLMPDESLPFSPTATMGSSTDGIGVTAEFRDAAGVRWRTNDRGELTEPVQQRDPSARHEQVLSGQPISHQGSRCPEQTFSRPRSRVGSPGVRAGGHAQSRFGRLPRTPADRQQEELAA
jgi:hypothetical protein